MKYTQAVLDKLERILEENDYIIRYERGSFQSGYCILESKRVVVLNKFLVLEGRIHTMMDIIPQLEISVDKLSPESRKLFDEVQLKYQARQDETSA
jgi:hypothetical protein